MKTVPAAALLLASALLAGCMSGSSSPRPANSADIVTDATPSQGDQVTSPGQQESAY